MQAGFEEEATLDFQCVCCGFFAAAHVAADHSIRRILQPQLPNSPCRTSAIGEHQCYGCHVYLRPRHAVSCRSLRILTMRPSSSVPPSMLCAMQAMRFIYCALQMVRFRSLHNQPSWQCSRATEGRPQAAARMHGLPELLKWEQHGARHAFGSSSSYLKFDRVLRDRTCR